MEVIGNRDSLLHITLATVTTLHILSIPATIQTMANLHTYKAKVCLTASGSLVHNNKILLVKHKKLGIWLTPGGHIDENELPHQAAEREFWEETGVKVKAVHTGFCMDNDRVEYVPSPISSNLHWVCKSNYDHRVEGEQLSSKAQKHWKKGCEQHLDMKFLVEPVSLPIKYKQNVEETDGIAWFCLDEIKDLETTETIKAEIQYAFKVSKK